MTNVDLIYALQDRIADLDELAQTLDGRGMNIGSCAHEYTPLEVQTEEADIEAGQAALRTKLLAALAALA